MCLDFVNQLTNQSTSWLKKVKQADNLLNQSREKATNPADGLEDGTGLVDCEYL